MIETLECSIFMKTTENSDFKNYLAQLEWLRSAGLSGDEMESLARHLDGESDSQIATLAGVTSRAIRNRLNSSRKKLSVVGLQIPKRASFARAKIQQVLPEIWAIMVASTDDKKTVKILKSRKKCIEKSSQTS